MLRSAGILARHRAETMGAELARPRPGRSCLIGSGDLSFHVAHAQRLLHLQSPAPRAGRPRRLLASLAGGTPAGPGRARPAGRAQHPPHDLPLRHRAGRRGRRPLRRRARGRRPAGAGRLRRHEAAGRPAGRHLPRPGVRAVAGPLVRRSGSSRLWPPTLRDSSSGSSRRPAPPGSSRPATTWRPAPAPNRPARKRPGAGQGDTPRRLPHSAPRPGGVFVVAGPLTDDSLLRLIGQLGASVSGLESCTSPDRWKPLAAAGARRRPRRLGRPGLRPPSAPAIPTTWPSPASFSPWGCAPAGPPRSGATIWSGGSTRAGPRRSSTPGRASATRARTTPCSSLNWPRSAVSPTSRSRWASPSRRAARCARGSRPSSRPNSSTTTCWTILDEEE